MALIIGQVAITAAGKVAVELRNTGATAVDLTGWNVTVVNNSSGRGFFRSGGGTMSPGGFYIVGHSRIPGLNATPSGLFPGLSPAKNIVRLSPGISLFDHFGCKNGPNFSLESGYQSPLDRGTEGNSRVDTNGDFAASSPFSTNTLGTACFLAGLQNTTPRSDRPRCRIFRHRPLFEHPCKMLWLSPGGH